MREDHTIAIPWQRIVLTMCLAWVLGFIAGFLHPRQQVAVEQGQVLADIVHYEETNPWYIYQAKAWNVSAQLSALGLRLGVSEVGMSMILSGVAGALFMVSVALLNLAVTNRITVSILVPFILLFLSRDGIMRHGYGYPIMLLNTQHTYGMIGLTFMTWVISFFMLKRERVGFCLLGLSVMVHPSLSIWLHVVLLIYVLLDIRHIRQWIGKALPAIGCYGLSLASLAWQRVTFTYPPLPPEVQTQYLDVIIEHWSFHGHYILELGSTVGIYLIVMVGCSIALLIRSQQVRYSYRFLSRVILIAIGVGLTGYLITRIPSPLADIFNVLLPNRLLNLPFFMFVSVVLGAGLTIFLQRTESYLKRSQRLAQYHLLFIFEKTVLVSCVALIALAMGFYTFMFSWRYDASFGFLDSPVFVESRQSEGLLLVAPVFTITSEIQLATARPLVMSPLADGYLPYAVEAGPITATLLDKIYHFDFFNPPDGNAHIGNGGGTLSVWENRTSDEWMALANEFGFTQVLMAPDRPLQLPVAAHDDRYYTLYDIPKHGA